MIDDHQLYKNRHSLSHLLAMAVLEIFPDAKLAIGPPIDNGFYYDFDLERPLTAEDLPDLQKRMERLVKENLTFTATQKSIEEARSMLAGQPYKLELLEDLAKQGETEVGFYTSGSFTDLCKGPHIQSTQEIPLGSFQISHTAGAYWRGDEKRPMLQRIYGLAFESSERLAEYQNQQAEAKKRDHRKLGIELDLFTFSDLVGPGLPLWTPRGNTVRLLLDDLVWRLRKQHGYERVEIPHITKKELYEISGHWEKFHDELFQIKTREGHQFVLKPMNCPHHTQIFARKKWSYRELPQRYANTTTCYRDEQTGELNGLSRVRAFSQDDAHVFCRYNQAKTELGKVWDIVESFYRHFKFDLKVRLSFHDPANQQAYLGDASVWEQAEKQLQELVQERNTEHFISIGEAAFYGPKVDFMAEDSLGREWQIATIQLDMNMPNQFGLSYTAEDGTEQPVLMIHAAIMGSLERFLAIIIEHTAGNFPFWLAPVQVSLIPVSEQFNQSAQAVAAELELAGIRVEVDQSAESVGKKIRTASLQKVPLKLVIGEQEVSQQPVQAWQLKPNWRSDLEEQEDPISLANLISKITTFQA